MTINQPSIDKLNDRAVYLVLSWSFLGTWKRVQSDGTSDDVRTKKRIINSDSQKRLKSLRNRMRRTLRQYTLNSLFRPGVYAIPITYVPQLEDALKKASQELEEIRADLKTEWPAIIKDAKKRLGDMFDASDYLLPDAEAEKLKFSYRYIPIAETPGILKSVAADIYQEDLERSKTEVTAELEAFRAHLRGALIQIIEGMRKTLTKPDGQRRVFGKRFFKNLNEFMQTFDGRNLSDDGELEKLVGELKLVAAGHKNPKLLKSDKAMQKKLDKSLEKIDESLKAMVADDGRMINLSMSS
jgi:hypothetical protein